MVAIQNTVSLQVSILKPEYWGKQLYPDLPLISHFLLPNCYVGGTNPGIDNDDYDV